MLNLNPTKKMSSNKQDGGHWKERAPPNQYVHRSKKKSRSKVWKSHAVIVNSATSKERERETWENLTRESNGAAAEKQSTWLH